MLLIFCFQNRHVPESSVFVFLYPFHLVSTCFAREYLAVLANLQGCAVLIRQKFTDFSEILLKLPKSLPIEELIRQFFAAYESNYTAEPLPILEGS